MARINSLLSIMAAQNADELRLASDSDPRIFAAGAEKQLLVPKMSDATVRDMLGEILSSDVLEAIAAGRRAEVVYEAGALGAFRVTLSAHEGSGIAATFLKGAASASRKPSPAPVRHSDTPAPAASRTVVEAPPQPVAQPTTATDGPELTSQLQSLLARAGSMRASDVHLADGDVPVVRVDGTLRALDDEGPLDVARLLGIHGELARDSSLDVPGVGRARIHVYATADGRAAAIRLLPNKAPSFAQLEMPFAFDDVVMLPHGLVIVAGATGSGKSTTLAALAEETLRRRSVVLVTLEDPIEYGLGTYAHSRVRRRQVGRDVPTFAEGLRAALREDPDVLLVGEMRDPETIALALTAAETGHLVLASIHSRSAASAIERIVDSYAAEQQTQIRMQLAESLRAVIAQRLVRRAGGVGRLPVVEVLRGTRAVASLIREGKTAQLPSTLQQGRRDGMISLERSLADRVSAGQISRDDAQSSANDVDALQSYLQNK